MSRSPVKPPTVLFSSRSFPSEMFKNILTIACLVAMLALFVEAGGYYYVSLTFKSKLIKYPFPFNYSKTTTTRKHTTSLIISPVINPVTSRNTMDMRRNIIRRRTTTTGIMILPEIEFKHDFNCSKPYYGYNDYHSKKYDYYSYY